MILPLAIKLLRYWIFDSLLDITALRKLHQNKSTTGCSVKRSRVIIKFGADSNKKESEKKFNFCRMMQQGLFPIPDRILLSDQHQSIPNKWKFSLVLTLLIIAVEFTVWLALYKTVFDKCAITNVTCPKSDLSMDIRFRFCIFIFCDLCISLPILHYLIIPYVVNRLISDWIYRKCIDDYENCCGRCTKQTFVVLRSGIHYFEDINCAEIIDHHLQRQIKQQTRVILNVIDIRSNIDNQFTSSAGNIQGDL